MTRDEIIGIAFKAGFPDWWLHPPEPERQDGEVLAMLGRFAALVAAAERVEWLHLWYESAKEQIAELEQPQVGEVVVTTNQEGQCVAVTRQDDDGCILSVIWEAQQPQVKQEPVAFLTRNEEGDPSMLFFDRREAESYCDDGEKPTPLYTHPQNLRCKSNQHRLATLWGYEKPQPPRQPLTDEMIWEIYRNHAPCVGFARAIEAAHGIGGEA